MAELRILPAEVRHQYQASGWLNKDCMCQGTSSGWRTYLYIPQDLRETASAGGASMACDVCDKPWRWVADPPDTEDWQGDPEPLTHP